MHLLAWKCVHCKIFTATALISLNSSLPELYNMHRIYYDIVHGCSLNVSKQCSETKCHNCMPVMSICQTVVCVKIRKSDTEVTIRLKNCEINESEKGKCIIFQKEGKKILNLFLTKEL